MSPYAIPQAIIDSKKRLGNSFGDVLLIDIQVLDGTVWYLADVSINAIPRIGGPAAVEYRPWLKRAGPMLRTRDTSTDAGDIVFQNISGNMVERDFSKAIRDHEFEGALAILRVYDPLVEDVTDEYHGYLSEQTAGIDEISFRMLQIFDTNVATAVENVFTENCSLRFKSAPCGSASLNTFCTKKFGSGANDCTSVERFTGCPTAPPSTVTTGLATIQVGVGTGNQGADSSGSVLGALPITPPGLVRR